MKAIVFTAFLAVCSCAKLDRTYLPPSANTAGGSGDILQTPVSRTNQGLGGLPVGSYENDAQGVVVDAAVGTRASNPQQSGLGLPRFTYGSTDSKVGEAAFRDKHLQGGPSFIPQGFQDFAGPERIQASRDRASNTVRYEANINPQSYNYVYETDNGISAGEDGLIVDGVKAKGGYSYTGDDGQVYTVMYTADEGGYKPQGAHLPTPPPIPVEILKSLEQNAKDEAAGLVDDGSYDAKKYNAGGEYTDSNSDNGSQSNKFANRPGSVQTSFINQNNARPNAQFGITQPANIQGSQNLLSFSGFNPQSQSIGQNAASNINQPGSSLSGSVQYKPNQGLQSNEYLPPKQFFQQNIASPTNIPEKQDSISQSPTVPLSQQNLQNQDQSLSISSSRPSSYDTSLNSVASSENSNSLKEITSLTPQLSTDKVSQQPDFGSLNTVAPSQTVIPSRPNNNNNLSSGAFQQQSSINSFDQQVSVQPTNEPSKELTTPFESTNTVSTQDTSFTQAGFGQKPISGVDESKPEIYEYNRPAPAGPTDAPIPPNTQNVNYNQDRDGSFTQMLQTTNDDKGSKPFEIPAQSRPTGSPFTSSVSNTQVALGTTAFGNPNKPSSNIFVQTQPTDATLVPSTGRPINNQYTLAQTSTNFQAPIQNSFANNLPSSTFFQPRPTIPSFAQAPTSQNQFTQPQGPDGSYYYDRPNQYNKRPQQANQFFQPQRPQFGGQTNFVSTVQSVPSTAATIPSSNAFQGPINGLTQASASSFDTVAPTFSTNQGFNNRFGNQQVTSQPGSAFAQAIASTQLPNKPQSTYEGEIYQYNKPEVPSSSSSESEGSGDFQPGTQSLPTVPTQTDSQESFAQQIALKPAGQLQAEKKPFRPLGSSILGSACCRGNDQFNTNKFGPTQFNSGSALQAKPQFSAGAEKFDTDRKPPSYDSTGYHY